jgi:hypothetical protein
MLWDLEIPSKIKNFGWRVLHGMIPCRGVLANRHMGNQNGCPICFQSCEDIKHALFLCDRAREVWRCLGIWGKIEELTSVDRSGSVVVEEIIRRGGRLTSRILALLNLCQRLDGTFGGKGGRRCMVKTCKPLSARPYQL